MHMSLPRTAMAPLSGARDTTESTFYGARGDGKLMRARCRGRRALPLKARHCRPCSVDLSARVPRALTWQALVYGRASYLNQVHRSVIRSVAVPVRMPAEKKRSALSTGIPTSTAPAMRHAPAINTRRLLPARNMSPPSAQPIYAIQLPNAAGARRFGLAVNNY